MKCSKERFRSREAAFLRARAVMRRTLDAGHFAAYRCPECRFSNGQRAWHWGRGHPERRRHR